LISTAEPVRWVPVHGGGEIADLLWSSTPISHAQVGWQDDRLPVSGLAWPTAVDLAMALGGRLPTSAEWEWMAAGPQRRRFPWGDQPWESSLANLRDSHHGMPLPVGSCPCGATPQGLLDVAGNVWEWTSTTTPARGVVVRGGSYQSPDRYATCVYINEVPPFLRSPGIGVRVVREP